MNQPISSSLPGTPVHTPSPTGTASPDFASRPSTARVITPAPSSQACPIIATASPASLESAEPSPRGAGPASTNYVIPPRPRPGRKPATDEPASKRKAQNRESQRAFRARKAAKLDEMQSHVEALQQGHQREMASKIAELTECTVKVQELQTQLQQKQEMETQFIQERDYWKAQAEEMQRTADQLARQLKERGINPGTGFQNDTSNQRRDSTRPAASFQSPQMISSPSGEIGCGNCKGLDDCACIEALTQLPTSEVYMPPVPLHRSPSRRVPSPMQGVQKELDFADREIDFTKQFTARRQENRASISFLTDTNSVDPDSKCGFCTDDDNCLCRDEALRSLQDPSRPSEAMSQPPSSWASPTPSAALSGPGTCEDCMANPRQRAWCQRVAQLRNEDGGSRPSSRKSSISSASVSGMLSPLNSRSDSVVDFSEKRNNSTIGCSDAFKLLDTGRLPMESDRMDWIRTLKPVNVNGGGQGLGRPVPMEPMRRYSALELDTASIIATLQQGVGQESREKREARLSMPTPPMY